MKSALSRSIKDLQALLPRLEQFGDQLQRLGDALLNCWNHRGKVLIAGNGGSAADAMHLAEELCIRFAKNRRAIEFLIPSPTTARIQECHKLLYHALCEWIESKVE